MRWWQRQRLDNLDTLEVATLTARISELETRAADTSYTDALVAALQRNAQGRVANPSSPYATAALETCAGLIGRAFAAAEIAGPGIIASALTPEVMTLIGRSLIRKGEILFQIDTSTGQLQLIPAMSHSIAGGPDPESWQYDLTLGGPSETVSLSLPAASVLHLRYASDPETPWRGTGPLQVAYLKRRGAEPAPWLANCLRKRSRHWQTKRAGRVVHSCPFREPMAMMIP